MRDYSPTWRNCAGAALPKHLLPWRRKSGTRGCSRGRFAQREGSSHCSGASFCIPSPSPLPTVLPTLSSGGAAEQGGGCLKETEMALPDELEKLNALHERSALTDEEFALAKKRLLEGAPDEGQRASAKPPEANSALNRLHRSIDDRWIGGVCGGLGKLSGIPSWSWRILFVLTAFLPRLRFLIYVLLWIFVPREAVAPPPVAAPREGAEGKTPPEAR